MDNPTDCSHFIIDPHWFVMWTKQTPYISTAAFYGNCVYCGRMTMHSHQKMGDGECVVELMPTNWVIA